MSTERLRKLKQFAAQMTGRDVIVEKAELFNDRAEVTVRFKGDPSEWMRMALSLPMLDRIEGEEDWDDPFGDPLSATDELRIAAGELENLRSSLNYALGHAENLSRQLADAQRALADVPVTDHTAEAERLTSE